MQNNFHMQPQQSMKHSMWMAMSPDEVEYPVDYASSGLLHSELVNGDIDQAGSSVTPHMTQTASTCFQHYLRRRR